MPGTEYENENRRGNKLSVIYSRAEVLQYIWESIGSIDSSQSALENDKSAAYVNALDAAKTIIFSPVDGQVAFEIRIKGGANNEINVINLYAMRGDDDHYTLVATLTVTTGQQTDGNGNNFIDTIAKSNDSWPDNGIEVISNGNDSIARVAMNTYGYSKFLYIVPTLASADLLIDAVRV